MFKTTNVCVKISVESLQQESVNEVFVNCTSLVLRECVLNVN